MSTHTLAVTRIPAARSMRARAVSQSRAFNHCRALSTTKSCSINPLMNLSALAFSKEEQYLSKARKIPRENFHPTLELIRSSEVDPFAPAPGASPVVVAALRRAQQGDLSLRTTYEIAVGRLTAQLEASKAELKISTEALSALRDKHVRLERHASLMIFTVVMSFLVYVFKPDLLKIIERDITSFRQDLRRFDWQWLGNPPSHKSPSSAKSKSSSITSSNTATITSEGLNKAQGSQRSPMLQPSETAYAQHSQSSERSWSRLFWAQPAGSSTLP